MHFPGPSAPPAYSNKLRTSEPGVPSASSGPPVYDNNMRRSSPVDHHTPQNIYGGFFSHVPQQSISPTQNYHVMMSVNSPPADTSTFSPSSPSNQWSDRYSSGQPQQQQQQQHVPIQQHTYPQVVLNKGSSETDLLQQARPHTTPLRHSSGSHTSPSSGTLVWLSSFCVFSFLMWYNLFLLQGLGPVLPPTWMRWTLSAKR